MDQSTKENGKTVNTMGKVNSLGLMDLLTRGTINMARSMGLELSAMSLGNSIEETGKMVFRMVKGHCTVSKEQF